MKIEKKILNQITALSALHLKEEDTSSLLEYLKETLSHFKNIEDIDTTNVSPLVSPFRITLKLRTDEVVDFPKKQELLNQAPQTQGSLVKVPPVV